jgi:glutamine amidotransferase PdxT
MLLLMLPPLASAWTGPHPAWTQAVFISRLASALRRRQQLHRRRTMPVHIGVLALQGGYKELLAALLRQPGVIPAFVRTPQQLRDVDALVIPGGESTTIGRLLVLSDLLEPLREFARAKPVFGICAGLIVLSDALAPIAAAAGGGDADTPAALGAKLPPQPLVGGLDITISRNHFGHQSQSSFRKLTLTDAGRAAGVSDSAFFIRAPAVVRLGAGVEALAEVDGVAVAVRAGHVLGVAFHPEVHNDDSYMRYARSLHCCFLPPPGHARTHTDARARTHVH